MWLNVVSLPVNPRSITVQSRVPLHRQKLHTTNQMIFTGLLEMTLQQLQGHTAEVIHCEHKHSLTEKSNIYCLRIYIETARFVSTKTTGLNRDFITDLELKRQMCIHLESKLV